MSFNASKCRVLSITRKKSLIHFNYRMNNVAVERCNSIKDIGIEIDKKLDWKMHILSIVKKSNKIMGLIKRTVGYKAPTIVKKQLYISLIRSCLEYCCPVWSGTTKTNTLLLERVQRAATRYMLQFPEYNYKQRLLELGLLPLTYRREFLDLCVFFKLVNNVYDFNISNHVIFTTENIQITRSTTDGLKLRIPVTNSVMYEKLYFNRIVFLWNSLPYEIRCQTSLNIFKSRLYSHFSCLLINHFDSNNTCTWSLCCRCSSCRLH